LTGDDEPHSLLILSEQEMVAVDLVSAGWPCYELPYLSSIHASAILSATHVAGVPQALWDRIRDAGESQRAKCSVRVSVFVFVENIKPLIPTLYCRVAPFRLCKNAISCFPRLSDSDI